MTNPQALISLHFPDLKIKNITKIGEGTGNIAYEVNSTLIFRFPKNSQSQLRLEQEISLQKILKRYSTLPFPGFIYLPQDHSFVGYQKILGTPLINIYSKFTAWDNIFPQLSNFLTKLHAIPIAELSSLNLLVENKSLKDWQKHGYSYYQTTKAIIPSKYHSKIDLFFRLTPCHNLKNLVFCHNDLGIEHILIDGNNVTGIIDWGGVALTDPACDFARIYRDLGEDALDRLLPKKAQLRDRAIFYGKCLIFEDIFYGLKNKVYLKKSLSALDWMFT
ncbi:MAG: aminoglycoside phosphotransferase family protein [Candidatus Shapirobacteria bacterium]|jgi:aminoglycoside phosphotransferase (APT) family kinase protein